MMVIIMIIISVFFSFVDLTTEEQKLLADIRRRKVELMQEIKVGLPSM